jgi:predicted Zn-dependent protease
VSNALELAERALVAAEGDEVEAVVQTERSGLARFARSEVHQPTLIENEVVQLRVVRDGAVGTASGNRVDDEGLKHVVERATEAATNAPADPDFPGLAPPTQYPDVAGFDEETAELGPDEQARLAAVAISSAGDFYLYGFYTSGVSEVAIASSTGVRASQAMTDASVLALAAIDGASGYAERAGWAAASVDPATAAQESARKAERTRDARELEPGTYRAVLEPYALGELIQLFAYETFSGLALVEERSYAAGRLGEQAFDEKITIADDPLDPRGLPKAFDFEGTPKSRVELVEGGVLRGAVWDRGSAARADGQESTGHAPPAALRRWGPLPFAVSVAGGDAGSTDELAEAVGDGIYVTRLHYLSSVHPREGVITGMTRDGTFRIREGKIAEPLVNLRFTVSVPEMLRDVPALSRETTLVNQSAYYDERYPYGTLVPALATASFAVTGTGAAPGI